MADLALDPRVVEEQVRRLNRQADLLGFLGVVVAFPFGAVLGGLPLVAHGPIPSKFGIATLLLGALLAGTLGYIVGKGRSFGYRLKAQVMLGQLRLEQNVEALLAVSERPVVPALPAAEPMPALPEPPRIEELLEAGLGMPTDAPVVDYTPAAEPQPEEIAPLPDPEPLPVPEPVQLPSWAADLQEVVAAAAAIPAPPAPEPEPEPEPTPTWALPVRQEPVAAPTLAAWAEPQEIAPAPTPEPPPAPELAPTPVWAVPAAEAEQPEPEVSPPAPAPPAPAPVAPPDLSTLSIAEIARLADAGSL